MRKLSSALLVLPLVGCGIDPLTQIAIDDPANRDALDDGGEGGVGNADGAEAVEADEVGRNETPTTTNEPLVCASGASGSSWRDTLPPLAAPPTLPARLDAGANSALATCTGDGVIVTDVDDTEFPISGVGHHTGRQYFEVEVRTYEPGWSQVGVFASPADVFSMSAYFMEETAAAGIDVDGTGVIGVAVDLDAGVAAFYVDGDLRSQASLAILPGIGEFEAGVVSMAGNSLALNFGAAPFAFAPPAGFVAWQHNVDDAPGACRGSSGFQVSGGPVQCTDCGLTGFVSDVDEETQLVVLGAYDTGSQANWTWGEGAEEVPVEGGHVGTATVHVDRPGKIDLVLSAYEPTTWTITAGPDTELTAISVFGMHAQTVASSPEGVPVSTRSICTDDNGGGNCDGFSGEDFPIAAHQWPFDTGGGDTQGFIRFAEAERCLPLKIFAGAYETRDFTVH